MPTKIKTWSKRAQKEHRKKLVAALRSGAYKQTRGELRGKYGFCCLGVACDISGVGAWEIDGRWKYNGRVDILPLEVMNWLGFQDSVGGLKSSPYRNLVTANDEFSHNFNQIADLIESGEVKTV